MNHLKTRIVSGPSGIEALKYSGLTAHSLHSFENMFTTQSTQRESYFFDLSLSLWGQIKILSPATRNRIRVDRMIDRNNRIGEVLGASMEIQKGINVTPPEGLCLLSDSAKSGIRQKKSKPSVLSVPLW